MEDEIVANNNNNDDDINVLRETVRAEVRAINVDDNNVANLHQLINRSILELNEDLRLDLKCQVLYGNNYLEFVEDFNLHSCDYYSEESIKDFMNSTNTKYLSTFSINIQSILSKYNDI